MKKLFKRGKKRIGILVLLVFMVLGVSTGAYAYWNSLQVTTTNYEVSVGDAAVLHLDSSDLTAAGDLVPAGQVVAGTSDVGSIVLTYTFGLVHDTVSGVVLSETFTAGTYFDIYDTINTTNTVYTNGDGLTGIFDIDYYWDVTTLTNAVDTATLTVTITLNEPDTEATYTTLQALVPADLTISITVTATPN